MGKVQLRIQFPPFTTPDATVDYQGNTYHFQRETRRLDEAVGFKSKLSRDPSIESVIVVRLDRRAPPGRGRDPKDTFAVYARGSGADVSGAAGRVF